MARVNKRLYGPAQLPATTGTRYTVPANRRAVIRAIHLSNPTAGAVDVTASIGADAAGTRFLDGYPIGTDQKITIYGPFTMEAAEILAMHASAATSIVAVVDGDEETLA
jgi:hypothetical protein